MNEVALAHFLTGEGPIIDALRALRASGDWETAKAAILAARPRARARTEGAWGSAEWYQNVEDRAFLPSEPGTWDELQEATSLGLLTPAQYDDLADTYRANQASVQSGREGPTTAGVFVDRPPADPEDRANWAADLYAESIRLIDADPPAGQVPPEVAS